jgi:phosphohistidine phosphatase SixA
MLLLRHASAGHPRSHPSVDRERPLDRSGRADARALHGAFAGYAVGSIVTSTHVRCLETVRPLAEAAGLPIEVRPELAPTAAKETALALLDELPETALVCTHREVIERLFDGEIACEKGGAWLLKRRDGLLRPVAYLPPPSSVERTRAHRAAV